MAGRHPKALTDLLEATDLNAALIPLEKRAGLRVARALQRTVVACAESFADGVVDAGEQRRIALHLQKAIAGAGGRP